MSWLSRFFDRRRARRVARVLAVLSDGGDHYGWPLVKATGLSAAGVYIALDHLESTGAVVSGWGAPVYPGGPRRRWYRLADPSAVGGKPKAPSKDSSDLQVVLREDGEFR